MGHDAGRGLASWSLGLLVLAVAITYAPALRGEFVWDDFDHVVQNERVTAPDGLVRSWLETGSPGFYPITYTTFFVEWRLGAGQPWLFHLDNILLHAGSTLLVARLAGALGLSNLASWFVAAVWSLHPMQVASVAWIAERKNTLYVLLYLCSVHLYIASTAARARSRARAWRYAASVVAFALALLSKAAALTLPAALVLVQWARRRPLDRRFWSSLLPYALVAIVASLALLVSVPAGLPRPSLPARLLHAGRALWFYVTTFVWPHPLLTMYPRWQLDHVDLRDALLWFGALAAVLAGLLVRDRVPRSVSFGLSFFLVNAALVVGLVWFTYLDSASVANHLAYLPNLGLAFAAVGGATDLARRLHVSPRGVAAALALWAAVLAAVGTRHTRVWRDTETFWTTALAANPTCQLCEYNLGKLFDDRGERDRAAEHYEAALRIRPDHDVAINLGNIRAAQGRIDDATALYRRAARFDPTSETPHVNLGLLAARAGSLDEAVREYRSALRLAPDNVEAINLLVGVLVQAGRPGEAIAVLEDGRRRAPDSEILVASLAWLRATSSDPAWRDGAEAVRLAERACQVTGYADPDDLDTLAAAYAEAGRFIDAVRTARRALELVEPESELADQVRQRLALYEAHQPFRSD
jgi:tetratricopeptide (TPR) repeat protein